MTHFSEKFSYSEIKVAFMVASVVQFLRFWQFSSLLRGGWFARTHSHVASYRELRGREDISQRNGILFRVHQIYDFGKWPSALLNMSV